MSLKTPGSRWPLMGVMLVAAALRLPFLDRWPPPMTEDECSRGYDAWCLLETGADRWGNRWPFFLHGFGPGDGTGALTTYLTIPFVAALGPTVAAIRMPDAVLGTVTVLLLYLWLSRRLSLWMGLAAAAVLATDPWHVALTRTAHECGFTPFFLCLALLGLDRAGLMPEDRATAREAHTAGTSGGGGRFAWALVSGIAFSLHTWTYAATRVLTPLFLLALCLVYFKSWRSGWRDRTLRGPLAAALVGLVVGAAPLWLTALDDPARLGARARATLLWHQDLTAAQIGVRFVGNWFAHFNPKYLFWHGDEMSGVTIPRVGMHLHLLLPVAAVGAWAILSCLRSAGGLIGSRWARFLVVWTIVYPMPAALCWDWVPHPLRAVGGLLLFPIVAALGVEVIRRRIAFWTPGRLRTLVGAAVLLLMVDTGFCAWSYARWFPDTAMLVYRAPFTEAFAFVGQCKEKPDVILVSNDTVQPYIHALLFVPIPPREWAEMPTEVIPGPKGFHQVTRLGPYVFAPLFPDRDPHSVELFQRYLAGIPEGALIYAIERPGRIPEGERLAIFGESTPKGGVEVRRFRWTARNQPVP